jgi:pimeloyl-ACP methyl ester carboxylesterase
VVCAQSVDALRIKGDRSMPIVKLSAGALHYAEQGSGIPLVLLHANPGDSRDFEAIMPTLARRYRVLALDWPGYGGSDLPSPPQAADVGLFYRVLAEFVAALSLPPALFIGNSVGGYAAARLAIEAPARVRGLVLVAPGGFTPHNAFTRGFCKLQGSRWSLPPRAFAALYLRRRTPAVDGMLKRAFTLQSQAPRIALNRALWRSFATPEADLRPLAGGIRAPTLLLFGKRDPAIPAGRDGRVAAACIPSGQFVALPCGHAPFAEVPAEFLEKVLPFLAGCGEAIAA